MKKLAFTFILILLCILPHSSFASEGFSYSFEVEKDATAWFGGVVDESNYFDNGYSLYVNNPFGEVRNNHVLHVLDYIPQINLDGGKVYTLSGYVINPMSDFAPTLSASASRGNGSNTVLVSVNGIGDEWGFFSTTFFAGESGLYNLSLQFNGGDLDVGFFVDELKLEETPCVLSSLNLSGPSEILIPATGTIKTYYRPYLLTSEGMVVDILTNSNLHFSVSEVPGISFNSSDHSLTITSEASVNSVLSIGCTLRNYKELTPVHFPITLTSDMIDDGDFSDDVILWESSAKISLHKDKNNSYISVPTDNYGGAGYYTTITYSKPQLLYADTLYVIRARIKSDNPERLTPIHAKNVAGIFDTTLYFSVTDISGDEWVNVFAAFIPENSGIYDIALNLCSQNDCTIFIDDIKLSCEELAPEYMTLHAPGNIALSNNATSYPFSALLRDQLGNAFDSDDVKIELLGNDGSIYFNGEENYLTVYPDTKTGVYTLKATYLPDPEVSASLNFTVSFDYIGDGTFEKTVPNEWWMVASPYESSLYMRSDGTSRRALVNCKGNYFMLLNNSYVNLVKDTAYVFNSSFSAATDCTGTLFLETLNGEMLPLAQFHIAQGSTLDETRLPELFLAEQDAVGRLFLYIESDDGSPFSLYADNLSLKIASIVAINPHIIGIPTINNAVEAGFTLYNNVAESDDNSACFVNWYVSSNPNGPYSEVQTTGKNIYFDTTFLNKYVYFEVIPVCPLTGFSGSTIRSLPFLVTYSSDESGGLDFTVKPIVGENNVSDVTFYDIESHWAEEDIKTLAMCGAVKGRKENQFSPDRSITRAEFAKILSIAFSVNLNTDLPLFADVKNSDWYYEYVNSLALSGIIKGTSASRFSPDKNITREEAATMIVRLYEKAVKTTIDATTKEFTDQGEISEWAVSSVSKAAMLDIVRGNHKGAFSPKKNLTRAEAAAIIVRLAEILN